MKKYAMQLIFGLPILAMAMALLILDSLGLADVADRAFLGGVIGVFTGYFFRKSPPSQPNGGI